MRKFISFVVCFFVWGSCFAQDSFPLSELHFNGPLATRAGESSLYCLLGNGFILTIRSDEEAAIVAEWRTRHPNAKAVPVAIMGDNTNMRIVYVWAVDGDDNLNLRLIEKGVFPASVMLDAVHFDQLLKMNGPSPRQKSIEAGYAYAQKTLHAKPQIESPPRRLVTDARYQDFLKALLASEKTAQAQKNGIWSDKYKGLREEENTAPLNALPPGMLGIAPR